MKHRWIIFAAAGLLAGRVWSDGMLIEAESPVKKISESREFGAVHPDPSAFSGAALTRFSLPGSCVYEFSAPAPGEYNLWLRYAANQNQKLTYGITADEPFSDPATKTAALTATGGLEAWNWIRLGRIPLKAIRYEITLQNTNIRMDCLWIGQSDTPPQSPRDLLAGKIDEIRRQQENPIEPVAPDWLAEADSYKLPEWYDSMRVCAHTRLGWPWLRKDPDTFLHAGEKLSSVGFKEIVRHLRGGGEAAWWQWVQYSQKLAHATSLKKLSTKPTQRDAGSSSITATWKTKGMRRNIPSAGCWMPKAGRSSSAARKSA
jgi:hypothetical protein